jgi:hypothetical protein
MRSFFPAAVLPFADAPPGLLLEEFEQPSRKLAAKITIIARHFVNEFIFIILLSPKIVRTNRHPVERPS